MRKIEKGDTVIVVINGIPRYELSIRMAPSKMYAILEGNGTTEWGGIRMPNFATCSMYVEEDMKLKLYDVYYKPKYNESLIEAYLVKDKDSSAIYQQFVKQQKAVATMLKAIDIAANERVLSDKLVYKVVSTLSKEEE